MLNDLWKNGFSIEKSLEYVERFLDRALFRRRAAVWLDKIVAAKTKSGWHQHQLPN
jgi:hypothetical protein